MVNAQEWLDENYPKDGDCKIENEKKDAIFGNTNNLGKTREEITKLCIIFKNLSGSLDLSNFINLKWVELSGNQLTEIILSEDNKLEFINFSNNQLTDFNYKLLNSSTLNCFIISDNNIKETNISIFSNLVNLKNLSIGNNIKDNKNRSNKFYGPLKSLQELTKLTFIDIHDNSEVSDLENLPENLQKIVCSGKNREKLNLVGNNLSLYKMFSAASSKKTSDLNSLKFEKEFSNSKQVQIQSKVTSVPKILQEEVDKKTSLSTRNYNNFHNFNINCPFALKCSLPFNKEEVVKTLPLRLYKVPDNQVIDSELLPNDTNYAIMSYVWGDLSDKDNLTTWDYTYLKKDGTVEHKQIGVNKEFEAIGTTKESVKALRKSIEACKFIGIDYLWMDQICINQFDNIEQSREVPKMKQYYSNATITLIAVDDEMGDISQNSDYQTAKNSLTKIINSSWFTRSWCFQEGILSKQTVFMFDDYMVDGRLLSLAWAGTQEDNKQVNFSKISYVFVTPLGWSYGAQPHHSIDFTLSESLLSIMNRKQSVPLDGFYSILGLIPYGDKVETRYKKFGHKYSVEDLENALKEVVEVAFSQNRRKEVLYWMGKRSSNCWYIPQINLDGSTNINELADNTRYSLRKGMEISLQGIKLKTEIYQVDYLDNDHFRSEEKKITLPLGEKIIQLGDRLIVIGERFVSRMITFYLLILLPRDKSRGVITFKMLKPKFLKTQEKVFVDLVNKEIFEENEQQIINQV